MVAILCIGCDENSSSPVTDESALAYDNTTTFNEIIISDADVSSTMLMKAKEFKEALTSNGKKSASVYLYRHTIDHYPNADKLAARLILLGYTDVLIAINPENGKMNSEVKNKDWLRKFNSYLNNNKVNTYALMFSEASQYDSNKNQEIEIHASVIQNFNNTVSKEERFYGAAADWEPHSLTVNNPYAGITEDGDGANLASKDRWANDRYTKGGANDKLLARTGEMLEYAKKSLDKYSNQYNLPLLPLNEAVNYHVQEQQNNANLSNGDVTTYLSDLRCQDINVMAYNNKKEEIWRRSEIILSAAAKSQLSKSVYICIKTQLGDDEGPSTSLQPQGWDYLIETLNFLHEKASSYMSMKGITIYEYSGLESMWIAASEK